MSSRHEDEIAFAKLVGAWAELDGLQGRQAQQVEQARGEGEDTVRLALAQERAVKDRSSELQQRLARVSRHAHALGARAGVSGEASSSSSSLTSLEACSRELTAVTTDLSSAESAWKWVERTRATASALPVAPAALITTPAPVAAGPSPAGLDRRLRFAAMFAVLLCVLITAAIFLL